MPKQNKMRKTGRNTSTNQANGSGNGTYISFRRGPKQPAPISNTRAVIRRKVAVTKATSGSVTIGDVSTALGAGGDFTIQKITGFSVPSDAGSIFGSSTFTAYGSNLMTSSSNVDDTIVQDSGTADSRASVDFSVPHSRAVIFNRDTASTVQVANCSNPCLWHIQALQFVS